MHSILEIQQVSRSFKRYQIKILTVPDVLIIHFWLYLITYVSVCEAKRACPVFSTIHSILDWLKLDSRERCPLAIGYQRLSKVEYPQSVHERNHFDPETSSQFPDFRHDLSPQWLFELSAANEFRHHKKQCHLQCAPDPTIICTKRSAK